MICIVIDIGLLVSLVDVSKLSDIPPTRDSLLLTKHQHQLAYLHRDTIVEHLDTISDAADSSSCLCIVSGFDTMPDPQFVLRTVTRLLERCDECGTKNTYVVCHCVDRDGNIDMSKVMSSLHSQSDIVSAGKEEWQYITVSHCESAQQHPLIVAHSGQLDSIVVDKITSAIDDLGISSSPSKSSATITSASSPLSTTTTPFDFGQQSNLFGHIETKRDSVSMLNTFKPAAAPSDSAAITSFSFSFVPPPESTSASVAAVFPAEAKASISEPFKFAFSAVSDDAASTQIGSTVAVHGAPQKPIEAPTWKFGMPQTDLKPDATKPETLQSSPFHFSLDGVA